MVADRAAEHHVTRVLHVVVDEEKEEEEVLESYIYGMAWRGSPLR
jgi:hypothetical protein